MTSHRQVHSELQQPGSSHEKQSGQPPSEIDRRVPRVDDAEVLWDNGIGVVVCHLDDPADLRSFRIVDANPMAAKLMGTTIENLRGKPLDAFPKFLESDIAKQCVDVLRSGKLVDLGDVPYAGDE